MPDKYEEYGRLVRQARDEYEQAIVRILNKLADCCQRLGELDVTDTLFVNEVFPPDEARAATLHEVERAVNAIAEGLGA